MSVISIMWLRQLKRYLRARARIVMSLGQPVLFLLAFGFGFGPVFEGAGRGSYIQFLAPGVIGMSVLFTAVLSGIELIWDRQFGFLKETLVAPVPRILIVTGRTLGGATIAMMQGAAMIVICLVSGFRVTSFAGLFSALFVMLLIAVLFTALGTAIATVLGDFQGFQLVMNFVVMPIFFLSGALFPLDHVPGPIQWAARINPLSYGIDGLRTALTGAGQFGFGIDVLVLSFISALLLASGSYLFSRIQL